MKYNYVVLQTDFGLHDNFAGLLHGIIYTINPKVKVIDLTHKIKPQNIFQAAFLLYYSYQFFPDRTIFLNIIDPGVGTERDIVIAQMQNKLFIAPDNGLLSFIAYLPGTRLYKLNLPNRYLQLEKASRTFHGRDIFAPISAYISKGVKLSSLAQKTEKIYAIEYPKLCIEKDRITGKIVYIDTFGNLITNIDSSLFQKFIKLANEYEITCKNLKISRVSDNYKIKEKFGIIANGFGLLEIFSPSDNAAKLLKYQPQEEMKVEILLRK